MEVYINKVVRIGYDEDKEMIQLEWAHVPNSIEFKDAMMRGLNLAEATNASKWYIDARNMGLINLADQEWLNSNLLPKVVFAGANKIAIVTGENYFKRICFSNVLCRLDENVDYAIFSDVVNAKVWMN
jgi:hypothetical protein